MVDFLSCSREPKPVVSWNPCCNGYYPVNGVQVGLDCNDTVYVARAWYKGALIPGKLHVGLRYATIPWENKEVPTKSYEVLLAPAGVLKWVKSSKGERVEGAVIGGFSPDGEELFIGRVQICGAFASGSIQPSRKCLLIPSGGTVRKTCTHCHPYEILVYDFILAAQDEHFYAYLFIHSVIVDEKYSPQVTFTSYAPSNKSTACWSSSAGIFGSSNSVAF